MSIELSAFNVSFILRDSITGDSLSYLRIDVQISRQLSFVKQLALPM